MIELYYCQLPKDLTLFFSTQNFHKIFGEKLLESIEVEEWKAPPSKRKDITDSTSVLMEARGKKTKQ